MKEGKVEFRTTVLNVPHSVTPLKFLGWLKQEADAVQANCTDSSFAIIKLFLPMRIRLAFIRKELDSFLQSIPDTHPNIHWIDVVQVENSLNDNEMEIIREEENKGITKLTQSVEEFLRTQANKK